MPKRLLHALAVFAVTASPLAAENLSIDHSAVGCVVAGKFPRMEARFVPGDAVAKARVFFTTPNSKRWYAVAMKPEGAAFSGILPKPKKSLSDYRYYIEVTDKFLATSRTAEYTTSVVTGPGGCKGKMMGGGLASAAVTLEVPAGAPAVPAGFSSSGLTAAGVAGAAAVATGAAVAGAAAGGGISTGVIVAVAGVAAAGAGVAVAVGVAKGGEDSAPARTTYAGTFSQPWQRSQTTTSSTGSSTCVFDNVLSGSVTITLEPSGGGANGQAQITIAETEARRTAGPLCSGGTPGPPAGGSYPVAVNGGSLTFKVPNNNGSNFSVPYDFDGVLSSGVIMGKMAFTAMGSSPGSGGFGNIVTQSGTTEIPVSLK